MSDCTAVVSEAQVDYLTLSTHHRANTDELRHHCERWVQQEVQQGARVRPFRLMGYVGWRAGRVSYGERENAGLVQLSGDFAARHFDTVYPLQENVSRLDVAVTARLPQRDNQLGARAYEQAVTYHEQHPRSALPSFHGDAAGGYTAYVGHRTSDYYLRIYNKEAEQEAAHDPSGIEQYRNAWRYELESKGIAASTLALAHSSTADRHSWSQSLVHNYTSSHGIEPAFSHDGNRVLGPCLRRRSDRDTRLAWVRATVRPALLYLLQTGSRDEVMQALGLESEVR
jgi:DNA relaxase NicK